MELLIFWVLAVGALGGALLVILPPLARNPLYSALALVASFVFLAGIYILLLAHFVAVLQILVYAGAIMVLFVFVIMLLNLQPHELAPARVTPARVLGAVAAAFVVTRLALVVAAPLPTPPADLAGPVATTITGAPVDYGTVKHVGHALFTQFLVPFELLSLVLLVAILGAVVLASRRSPGAPTESAPADGQEGSR